MFSTNILIVLSECSILKSIYGIVYCVLHCVHVQVRAVCGATYMLTQDEELWEKTLPPAVEELLSEAKDPLADRSDRSMCICIQLCILYMC